ncbi:MAG: helix-turn-helix transcriptional regulator, partial [Rubrivivax sp.]|nr:helix-turn-helix transcriptional regulator [Rubrivivax sp.]
MTRYQLDQAVLCTQRGQLRVDGVDVPLGSRACALLEVLVTHEGRLVSKAELMAMVWPRLVVEENNLHVQVAALRKALGARAIVNVPGRGYRYVGSIQRLEDDASPAPAARPSATPPAMPAGEPAEADRTLIGRAAELDDLCAQVRQLALVTVVGAGGMGKTRLALAAAAHLGSQFADGARVVDLAAVASPAEVPAHVGRAFGIQLGASDGALAALVERLGRSSALLVLDNCEHVVGVVAELVSALLAAAPGLHVLATSQEPLHLKDERQCRLAPLAVPAEGEPGDPALHPALALLAQRVRAQQGRFDLDASTLGDATDIV